MAYEKFVWWVIVIWAVWNSIGVLAPLFLTTVPWRDRGAAVVSMLAASAKGTLLFPVEVLAPVVVPVALLFTKWEDDQLPKVFQWWDNDVSINGDLRMEGSWDLLPITTERKGTTEGDLVAAANYWAKGHHPRSFWSRYVWLGWRNRASALSATLGTPLSEADTREFWGDTRTLDGEDGWVLVSNGTSYQLYANKGVGPVRFRYNWGFKLWAAANDRHSAPVVNTTVSFKRRKN